MKKLLFFLLAATYAVCLVAPTYGAEEIFPLRAKWPKLVPISTQELDEAQSSGRAVIIDVRTPAEFDVMQIKGSHNIIAVDIMWQSEVFQKLMEGRPDPLLVFYCNGVDCTKSYKAAETAVSLGFQNVRVYDAGIFDWARNYPERTVFFGKAMTKASLSKLLISDDELGKRLVDTDLFLKMAQSGKYAVVDIRDPRERVEHPIEFPNIKQAPLDAFVLYLETGVIPRESILLLDNVGRQVIWAHYYLKKHMCRDYYFLRGGVKQWQEDGFDSKANKLGKVFGPPPTP